MSSNKIKTAFSPEEKNTVRVVEKLRVSQEAWASVPLRTRLRILRRFSRKLIAAAPAIIRSFPNRPAAQTITAELLPLLAACSFLVRRGRSILRARKHSIWGRPWWLWGAVSCTEYRPLGVVLVLSPGNYPLMLSGIQTLQALAAGNTVALKPAPGHELLSQLFVQLLQEAGIPEGVVQLIDPDDGPAAICACPDMIILTGSHQTGRKVAALAAKHMIPTIMELSGSDPVFVLQDADLHKVARALRFGMQLNQGATCIAPRRVFLLSSRIDPFEKALHLVFGKADDENAKLLQGRLAEIISNVTAKGGSFRQFGATTVLFIEPKNMDFVDIDLFAPWFAVLTVDSIEEAIALERSSRHRLGASIFGNETDARELAARIGAGSICINDLIVPTADPRLPFGGSRASGHGSTRGKEGLLAMTRPVSISIRRRGAAHLWSLTPRRRAR